MRYLLWILAIAGFATLAVVERCHAGEFGGCFGASEICAGPSVTVGMAGYNLTRHRLEAGLLPVGAAGYQITAYSSQWYQTGVSLNLALRLGSESYGALAVVGSFARYLRLGVMASVRGDDEPVEWSLIGGLGTGL